MRTRKSTEMNLPGSATEDQFHGAVAELLDWILIPPNTFYTTFPAGYGRLGKATAGRLRAKGMKAGMPDILIFSRCEHNKSYVLGLELKAGRNTATTQQRQTHAALKAVGVTTHVVHTLGDVVRCLHSAGIPYRSHAVVDVDGTDFAKHQSLSL